MQEGPWVIKCPIAIQFLATYVIVMGLRNHSGSIKMDLLKLNISNDPCEVMTYAALYEIGDKAFYIYAVSKLVQSQKDYSHIEGF